MTLKRECMKSRRMVTKVTGEWLNFLASQSEIRQNVLSSNTAYLEVFPR